MSAEDREMQHKIALAHHWLVSIRGGEKVLRKLCDLFPGSPVHTLVHNAKAVTDTFGDVNVVPSILQKLPLAERKYKQLLPLHPFAVSRMRCHPQTRLLISSDAAMIKGIRIPDSTFHVCYCHSPPRYLWEMSNEYASQSAGLGFFGRTLFRCIIPYCKRFDLQSSKRVDRFIANSVFVRNRIANYYGKDADVIYPPVDVESFVHSRPRDSFYLIVSELVPYKRVDLAVAAFSKIGKELCVIGDGSERKHLESIANTNIRFLGRQPFSVLKDHYERCRGFIFPGIEDFGITPVEAMAAGAPVIALAKGGALETVVDSETGVFFQEQTVESLTQAVLDFDRAAEHFSPAACNRNARRFGSESFLDAMRTVAMEAEKEMNRRCTIRSSRQI